jgi:hypothetical protein
MQSPRSRVLAFDIGIKNLAWCCAERTVTASSCAEPTVTAEPTDTSSKKLQVLGWANENLVTGVSAGDQETCALCAKKPSFTQYNQVTQTTRSYCVKHCNALRDLSGNLLRKIPVMGVIKAIAKQAGASVAETKTKEMSLAYLETKYALPIVTQKVKSLSLEDIHDGIRAVVQRNATLFASCTEILLENQPAFKNPVMKSVQMMLFATLRDLLKGPPRIRLVHASKKSAGATKGDEGYSERKNMTETAVEKGLLDGSIVCMPESTRHAGWFKEQSKKSDLADCLIMVQDALGSSKQ